MRAVFILTALFLFLPSVSSAAKPKSNQPKSAVISVDVEELRAGPGAAYISRGRTYRGESVRILETSDTGEWVRVEVSRLEGWLPAKSVRLGGTPVKSAPDAGRDRRQSNYAYDKSGRRRRLDGQAAGSGEGLGEEPVEDRIELPEAPRRALPMSASKNTISMQVGVGAGVLERNFQADIEPESFLSALDVSAPGLATHLALEWRPLPIVTVSAFGRDVRLGKVQVIRPGDVDRTIVELSTEAQQVGLDVLGRVSMGPFWVGGGLGGRYLRHAFRETKPVVVFLTTSVVGLAGVLEAGARLNAFDMRTSLVYVHPLSIEQTPLSSGTPEGSLFEMTAQIGYRLTPFLSLYLESSTTGFNVDYTGRATHRDTVTRDRALVYESATEENTLSGFTVGVRWSN